MKTYIKTDIKIQTEYHLLLTEAEARALDGLCGYNFEEFIKVFYEKMGKHYLEPHEAALKTLFEKCHGLADVADNVNRAKHEAVKILNKVAGVQ